MFLEKTNFGHDSSSLLFYCKCPAVQTNAKRRVHAADIVPIFTKKNGLNKSCTFSYLLQYIISGFKIVTLVSLLPHKYVCLTLY